MDRQYLHQAKLMYFQTGRFGHEGRGGDWQIDHFDVIWILTSKVDFTFQANESVTLSPQQCLVVKPKLKFNIRALSTNASAMVFHFSLPVVAKNCQDYYVFPEPSEYARACIQRLLAQDMEKGGEDHSPQLMNIFSAFIYELFEQKNGENSREPLCWMRRIEKRPFMEWDLSAIAKESGMGMSRLAKEFKRVSGSTFSKFVREQRLIRSSKLLRESQTPIKQIAARAGYSHLQHFHRAFTAFYGVTPADYRRRSI